MTSIPGPRCIFFPVQSAAGHSLVGGNGLDPQRKIVVTRYDVFRSHGAILCIPVMVGINDKNIPVTSPFLLVCGALPDRQERVY